MVVGVLAFQGDVAEHKEVLASLRVASVDVRTKDDLVKVDALIIPGGESTVIARFLEDTGVGKEIVKRVRGNDRPLFVFGTCAGAIVLAKKATGKNAPKTLGLLDATIDRNAYGTQIQSFETFIRVEGMKELMRVAFIRAPKITAVSKKVEVLASYDDDPVLVCQGRVLICTFHPEVRGEKRLHKMFLDLVKA